MGAKEDIFEKLNEAVLWGEEEDAAKLATEALEAKINPKEIVKDGMSPGVQEAGEKFNEGEFFLPELMLAGEAMKEGLKVVMPALLELVKSGGIESAGKIMMGTVEGDVHDIGKNICLAMLTAEGFETIDMGVDNELDDIVAAVKKEKPDILGLGSYMTTTMVQIKPAFDRLKAEGLTDDMVILSGGVAVNRRWSKDIAEADGYGEDAWDMIKLCQAIMSVPKDQRVDKSRDVAFSDMSLPGERQSA